MKSTKICEVCNKEYSAIRIDQHTCGSAECRKIRNREYQRKRYLKKPRPQTVKAIKKQSRAERIKAERQKVAQGVAIARALGIDDGYYQHLVETGKLEEWKRKKFREMAEKCANEVITEETWIGGGSGRRDNPLTTNPMQKLTDYTA